MKLPLYLLACGFLSACFSESHEVPPFFFEDGGPRDTGVDSSSVDGAMDAAGGDGGLLDGEVPSDAGRADGEVDAGPDAGPDAGSDGGPAVACLSPEDTAGLARNDYGPEMNLSFAEVLGSCGLTCAFDPNLAGCIDRCIVGLTGASVSEPCTGCFVGSVVCATENCLIDCITGTADACLACQCGANPEGADCLGGSATCSGLPSACGS